jgi:hypothetical protein
MSDAMTASALAVHEAGHAVLARLYSSGEVRATIESADAGHCLLDLPEALPSRMEALRRAVIVLLGGRVAELMAQGRDPTGPAPESEIGGRILRCERPFWRRSEGADDRHALAWLGATLRDRYGDELYCYRLRDAMLEECLHRTVALLEEHWAEVESLALRLQRQGSITI